MIKEAKVYIAGHTGLLGSAIFKRFKKSGFKKIVARTRQDLDLTRQSQVEKFFIKEKPDYVILAAAKVGGISANIKYPAEFLYENLCIEANIINSSFLAGVKKLLFFGSACSYPRESRQPMKEEYLLGGYLEPTNEYYAIAKISGIKMCQGYNRQYGTNFLSCVPTNFYGPNDNFNSEDSHVIPALIRKFHRAKIKNEALITLWGTGTVLREFIYVDDVADACMFLMQNYKGPDFINIGTGEDISIKELANLIKDIVGYNGRIIFDITKPDGAPRKLLDIHKLKRLGWQAKVSLAEGIKLTYEWYLKHPISQ